MSLREQFLKFGLITKQQANKLEAEKRKQNHALQKDKVLLKADLSVKQEQTHEFTVALEAKKQRDIELNKRRDHLLAQREQIFRVRQLINSNALNSRSADEHYFFEEKRVVRKVYVTTLQREMLARGVLGIVRPDISIDDFVILRRDTAIILLEICPEKVIVLYSEIANFEECLI